MRKRNVGLVTFERRPLLFLAVSIQLITLGNLSCDRVKNKQLHAVVLEDTAFLHALFTDELLNC